MRCTRISLSYILANQPAIRRLPFPPSSSFVRSLLASLCYTQVSRGGVSCACLISSIIAHPYISSTRFLSTTTTVQRHVILPYYLGSPLYIVYRVERKNEKLLACRRLEDVTWECLCYMAFLLYPYQCDYFGSLDYFWGLCIRVGINTCFLLRCDFYLMNLSSLRNRIYFVVIL